MENNFIENVLELHKQKNWLDIVKLNPERSNLEATKLLWVWPSEENLKFLKIYIEHFKLNGVISIGCGCGLLEWIFREYSNLDVIGYEVNEEWWKSRYSIPQFIDLIYTENNNYTLESNYALLFCYFNNGRAFNDYVENYNGNVIFIIGPGEGRGTHTDPAPFEPNFEDNAWILEDYQEVKETKDFIAVYVRRK